MKWNHLQHECGRARYRALGVLHHHFLSYDSILLQFSFPLVSSLRHGIRELSLGADVLFSYHLLLLMFHQLLTTWHFGTNESKHKWTHGTEIVLLGDHTDDLELHCPIWQPLATCGC